MNYWTHLFIPLTLSYSCFWVVTQICPDGLNKAVGLLLSVKWPHLFTVFLCYLQNKRIVKIRCGCVWSDKDGARLCLHAVEWHINVVSYCHMYECDCRCVLDWWSGLSDAVIHTARDYTLQYTVTHTHKYPQSRLHWPLLDSDLQWCTFSFPNCLRPRLPASHGDRSQELKHSSSLTKSSHSPTN
jgi:hypothetical protein